MPYNATTVQSSDRATPFLTEGQRATLDAALSAKADEESFRVRQLGGPSTAHHSRLQTAGSGRPRLIRDPGASKKGGGGGRFTWGSLLTNGSDAQGALDRNDPNYDSDEERQVVMRDEHSALKLRIIAYKRAVQTIVEEYFDSSDTEDVASSLEELGAVELEHYFVKRLLTLSLDRGAREREMASNLLSSLYDEVIPPEEVQKGFLSLVEGVDDLVLDVPAATDLLATFIARAVVDDILPPSLLSRIPDVDGSLMAELKHKAEVHLGARHAGEKMMRCWGAGSGQGIPALREAIAKALQEFVASRDGEEACRCLQALHVPFFHHEFVKQAACLALEEPVAAQPLAALLARMVSSGEVSPSQLAKGLARVADNLDDTCLDNPAARERHAAFLEHARAAGLVDVAAAVAQGEGTAPSAATAGSSNGNGHAAGSASTNGSSGQQQQRQVHSLQSFKLASVAAVKEYFASADAAEVANRLQQLADPGLQHLFVKHAISLAMDRKDRERELVSTLLVSLHPQVITGDQMASGFTRLLAAVDDLSLDIPDAVRLLSLFLGRAIVDELLPPSFLAGVVPALRAESLGINVIKATASLLSVRHGAERLTNCWHGGALSLEQIREAIRGALQEYLASQDPVEAAKCVAELNVPYYHHEVVAAGLEAAFEKEANLGPVLLLLGKLAGSGQISQTQVAKGFVRIQAKLDDEVLDYPNAKAIFAAAKEQALKEGWLQLEPDRAAQ